MSEMILRSEPLTHPWAGTDPFLFCAHHLDHYPAANNAQGVDEEVLRGRPLGNDFSRQDGFSMYYGTSVPGFPAHPHRGFETVTIVPAGLVDHADSLGATARYGDGDVQWLTAGRGVMHSEMFPLRNPKGENLLDLYQIWLNLPARSKMSDPAFVMLWDGKIPRYRTESGTGAAGVVKVIAGAYSPQEAEGPLLVPPSPAPDSWASNSEADIAIWHIILEPGASLTLPPSVMPATRRTLYFHGGDRIEIAGQVQPRDRLIEVRVQAPLPMTNVGRESANLLVLQGVPIAEPVVAHGPFVMNTEAEIDQARRDFGRTQFGGWPWGDRGPVHRIGQQRFARYPGQSEVEFPPTSL